jgi:CHAT domain-containing protein
LASQVLSTLIGEATSWKHFQENVRPAECRLLVSGLLGIVQPEIAIAEGTQVVNTNPAQNTEADRLLKQGNEQLGANQPQEAFKSLQQALEIYRKNGDRAGEGQTLKSIGNFYYKKQDYPKAIEYYQKALTIAREIKNADLESRALNNIGTINSDQKKYDTALAFYQQALVIGEKSNNQEMMMVTLYGLMKTHEVNHNSPQQVIKIAQRLLELSRSNKAVNYEQVALISTARAYFGTKKYQEMMSVAQQVIAFGDKTKNPQVKLAGLSFTSLGYKFLKDNKNAAIYLRKTVDLAQSISDDENQFLHLVMLGNVYSGMGDSRKISELVTELLPIVRRNNSKADKLKNLTYVISLQQDSAEILFMTAQVNILDLHHTPGSLKIQKSDTGVSDEQNLAQSISLNEKTLELIEEANSLAADVKDAEILRELKKKKISIYKKLSSSFSFLGQEKQALGYAQKIEEFLTESLDPQFEIDQLAGLTVIYLNTDKFLKAEKTIVRSIELARKLRNPVAEAELLGVLADSYYVRGQYVKADEIFKQAISLSETLDPEKYNDYGIVPTETTKQSSDLPGLPGYRKSDMPGYRDAELLAKSRIYQLKPNLLSHQKDVYQETGKFDQALAIALERLALVRKMAVPTQEIDALRDLADIYRQKKDFQRATQLVKESIAIAKRYKEYHQEVKSLIALSSIYQTQDNGTEATLASQEALTTAQQYGSTLTKLSALDNLADLFAKQDNFAKSLEYRQASLNLAQDSKQPFLRSFGYSFKLANAYLRLGDYETSRQMIQQMLGQTQKLNLARFEVSVWNLASLLAFKEGKQQEMLEAAKRAESISQDLDAPFLKFQAAYRLITIYGELGDEAKSIEAAQSLLAIAKQLQDAESEKSSLQLLGMLQQKFGKPQEAIKISQAALAISATKDNINSYHTLAKVYDTLNQPTIAIAFYKKAISEIENVRLTIKPLNPRLQKAFLEDTVDFGGLKRSDMYRELARLLLSQNRTIEALQVLDLLKQQEFQDFFKTSKSTTRNDLGIELLPQEASILQAFDKRDKQSIEAFFQRPDIQTQLQDLNRNASQQNLQLNSYQDLKTRINKLGKNVALFYPLILNDRLELVILTNDRPPIHKPIPIARPDLEKTINTFRKQLEGRSPQIKQSAQTLYTSLFQPIEDELKAAGTQTIVYAPDSIMRYVPLAALYDGNQWLAERYQINYLTALALTPLDPPANKQPRILAGALTQGYSVDILGKTYRFNPLSFTQREVDQLEKTVPNTTKLIDRQFNLPNLTSGIPNHNILHLATHGLFIPNSPDRSIILLGDGKTLSLREIEQQWKLPNVSLVVLSACETALGGNMGNGLEVLGFGYQMQRIGSRSAMASLWKVDDPTTSLLMQEFYQTLSKGKVSQSEALRQVQQKFIQRQLTGKDISDMNKARSDIEVTSSPEAITKRLNSEDLTHPYYWAPFILIGNSL